MVANSHAPAEQFTTNPRTKRLIKVGGALHQELVAAGIIPAVAPTAAAAAAYVGVKRSSYSTDADMGIARKRSKRFAHDTMDIEVVGGGAADSLAAISAFFAAQEKQVRQALTILFTAAKKAGKDTSSYEHTSELLIASLTTGDEVVKLAAVLKELNAFTVVQTELKPVFLRVVDAGTDPLRLTTNLAWKDPSVTASTTSSAYDVNKEIDEAVKHLQAQSLAMMQDVRTACTSESFAPILSAFGGVQSKMLHLAQRWIVVLRPSIGARWEAIRSNPKLSVAEQARSLLQEIAAVDPDLLRVLLNPSALRVWMERQLDTASASLDDMMATAVTTILSLNFVMRTAVKTAWSLVSSVIPGDHKDVRAETRAFLIPMLSARTDILAQAASNALVVFFALSFMAEHAVKTALK
jgi:hypothetical protein